MDESDKPYVKYPPDPPDPHKGKLVATSAVILVAAILWRLFG